MKRGARIALASAVGLGLLAWLTRGVDLARISNAVRPAPWWIWTGAILGLLTSYLFRALRIRTELGTRITVGVLPCLQVMLVHNAAVNVFPMRGGEAAYPWLLNRRLGVPVSHAVASLVWFRVQDLIVLAMLASALWPGIAATSRIAAAVGIAAAVAGILRLLERAAIASPAPSRRGPIRALHGALQALALAPRHGLRGWLFCVGSWSAKLAALGALLAALSGLGLTEGWTGALGGELAGVLPVQGPAGLGTYETGVWAGAAIRGRSAIEIAAPALAVHLVSFATAVLTGAVAHLAGGTSRTAQPAARLEHDHG